MEAKSVPRLFSQLVQRYPCCRFGGLYMSDSLPRYVSGSNIFYVINTASTDDNANTMGHYILLYISHSYLVYFDSFGLPLDSYPLAISRFVRANIGRRNYVDLGTRVQHELSLTCGAFVVYVAFFLCRGGIVRACAMLGRFSRNYAHNDELVLTFLYARFGRSLPACSRTFCIPNATRPRCITDCQLAEASALMS